LAPSVAELTTRLRLQVDVDVSADRFPAPVEATAYFVIAEALTNVVKHARARSAAVRVQERDGALEVEVQDDGIGGASQAGSGLGGLADRVVALGGRLQVDSPDGGGPRVTGMLPLPH
jgi:signal transduction histidine kinase